MNNQLGQRHELWSEFFGGHFQCLTALVEGRREEAYGHLTAAVPCFIRVRKPSTCMERMHDAVLRRVRGHVRSCTAYEQLWGDPPL